MGESIRVLHADDEPDFADLAATFLEREDDRFAVETVACAREGLDRLAEAEFDCVVSDHDMPGRSGIEFLEAVREDYPELPFILFTGKGSEEVASEAISAGVTDYLQKGTGTEQYALLANRIANAVERYHAERDLRRREERLEALLKHSSDSISIVDERGVARYSSPSIERQLGYDPEAWVGEQTIEYVHPDDRDRAWEAFREFVDGDDEIRTVEYRLRHADGSYRWIEAVWNDQLDNPAVAGIVLTRRDVTERKRRERELERYETVVETLGDSVYTLDADGRYTFVNDAFVEATGYAREDVLGEHVSLTLPEGDIERSRAVIRDLLEGEGRETAIVEAERITADGERVPVEIHIRPLPPGPDGEFRGTAGVARDVSERKERERELERERSRFGALFEHLPEPVVEGHHEDGEPVVEAVNPAFEEVFGIDEDTIVGEPLDEYIVPEGHMESAAEINERVDEQGRLTDVSVRRMAADGPRDFLLRNAQLPETERNEGFAIYTDITEQKERERQLVRLHEATRELIEADTPGEVAEITSGTAEDILGFSTNGVHLYEEGADGLVPVAVSASTKELLGEPPVLDEGLAWRAFRSGESRIHDDVREDGTVYNPDTPIRSEMHLPLRDRGVLIISSTEAGAFDEAEVALAKILAANAAHALDRTEREQELKRQNERLDEFTSIVSHDLRNPLGVAEGRLELAREECNSEHLDGVSRAHDRMRALIDDLLTFAREGEEVMAREPIDLAEFAEGCWENVDTGEATLTVETDLTISGDEGRLEQLLENLFRNAVEHSSTGSPPPDENIVEQSSTCSPPPDENIVEQSSTCSPPPDENIVEQSSSSARSEAPGGAAVGGGAGVTVTVGDLDDGFYVEDDGPGIPEREREQVFESGHSTSEEGTGFGLSIVERIAEAHGWEVRATDGEEGGARFEVTGVKTR